MSPRGQHHGNAQLTVCGILGFKPDFVMAVQLSGLLRVAVLLSVMLDYIRTLWAETQDNAIDLFVAMRDLAMAILSPGEHLEGSLT